MNTTNKVQTSFSAVFIFQTVAFPVFLSTFLMLLVLAINDCIEETLTEMVSERLQKVKENQVP